jgi:hypothetical protein
MATRAKPPTDPGNFCNKGHRGNLVPFLHVELWFGAPLFPKYRQSLQPSGIVAFAQVFYPQIKQ